MLPLEPGALNGEAALVIGGAGGVGSATAELLQKAGATVAIADVAVDRVERVRSAMAAHGANVFGTSVDVADRATVERAVAAVVDRLGKIDILAYTAGSSGHRRILDVDDAYWDQIFDVNLRGVFFACQAVLPGMIERRHGRIVAVSSVLALMAKTERGPYAAAKAGLIALMKDLALEVAPYGITANIVANGATDTPMLRDLHSDDELVRRGREIPLGRVLRADEVAAAIVYLVSPAAAMITGQTLHINGGLYMP